MGKPWGPVGRLHRMMLAALAAGLACSLSAENGAPGIGPPEPGLTIEDLGKKRPDLSGALPELKHLPALELISGGNTSFRNDVAEELAWKGSPDSNGTGYFQRNRDLGQTFVVPPGRDVLVRSIVLRTGRGNNAVMAGAPGARLLLQWFAVEAIPGQTLRIDDRGTPQGSRASHGFDMNLHRADDVVEGVRFRPLRVFSGGPLPNWAPTTQPEQDQGSGAAFGEQAGHLRYFRVALPAGAGLRLKGGRRFAFVVGFAEPGARRGIGLANHHTVHSQAPPEFMRDARGKERWAIRREGNGRLPPTMIEAPEPPADAARRASLVAEAVFPARRWESLMPTSDGYPDVDTYRTLEFAVEGGLVR